MSILKYLYDYSSRVLIFTKFKVRIGTVLLGPLAQSVEQQTFNLWVVGSIPTGPTVSSQPQPQPQLAPLLLLKSMKSLIIDYWS
jgi:hypothetical protein